MNNLYKSLSIIGINYPLEKGQVLLAPEEVIIEAVYNPEILNDKKDLLLLMLWLKSYSRFVHVERLKAIYQASFFDQLSLAILGSLLYYSSSFDHRFKSLAKDVLGRIEPSKIPLYKDDEFLMRKKGIDPYFKDYSILLANLEHENERKLKPIPQIIKENLWIKNRVLFGANLRADIATIRELGTAHSAYAASKIARCSPGAAKKNWDDLALVGL